MTEKSTDIKTVRKFINDVRREYEKGDATEHSYRRYLLDLIETLDSKVNAINESKQIGGNAVDITVKRNNIAVGYLEAKDINVDINDLKGANIDQHNRYTKKMANLIYTNCLKWDFYRNGDLVRSVSIAKLKAHKIIPTTENFAELADYLQDFLDQSPQTIKTAEELTEYMARKTRIIHDAFRNRLMGRDPLESLERQYKTVVKELIKGLKKDEFADIYAQTITYGLFVARLNSTPETFNREKLQELVPKNYPFLKDLFEFIAAKTLGDTLDLYIDDLIEIYRATDDKIMKNYEEDGEGKDPFLHFYEDFLKKYDPAKRKKHGVYYTPEPVVDFIVQAVDWVLKSKFNLQGGLANSDKIDTVLPNKKMGKKQFDSVHRVQILDPATGTGTFLARTIHHIAEQIKPSTSGNWSSYVDADLLPRLHGFEIMMAPYVMCYLKLNMLLAKLGYTAPKKNPKRMSIYLTNSLTGANEHISDMGFNNDWLEEEARGAKEIKDNHPIMCVIGNPPYSGLSQNMGKSASWINDLIEDYKYVAGGHFKERKHWLHNDYVKFIRFAQHMVDKNGEGVVGMITDHSYLEGPTFRGMRWQLMNSFDEIYILDLHGSTDEKKFAPKGKNDENVFDIQQGVSIIIAWKTKQAEGAKKPLAQVFRGNLWGTREEKFDILKVKGKALSKENLDANLFQKIDPRTPDCFFKQVDYKLKTEYDKGFKITEFMPENSVGIVTARDNITIHPSKNKLWERINDFANLDAKEAREKYQLGEDSRDWNLVRAQEDVSKLPDINKITPIQYRPFDTRWTYYTGKSKGFYSSPCRRIMRHFLDGNNLGLLFRRGHESINSAPIFCTKFISSSRSWSAPKEKSIEYSAPLYVYLNEKNKTEFTTYINMDETIRKAIEDVATDSKHGKPDEYAIFDYIYGLLHAPDYRERYAEFLKEDFPRIPYPKDSTEFWYLSSAGTKLRKLHLMEGWDSPDVCPFNGTGNGVMERPTFDNEKVFINKTQYFDNVPESAWELYIGGYQPAQKWLKDRKGTSLDQIDITHYQRIIAVLVETEQTMQTIKWSRE